MRVLRRQRTVLRSVSLRHPAGRGVPSTDLVADDPSSQDKAYGVVVNALAGILGGLVVFVAMAVVPGTLGAVGSVELLLLIAVASAAGFVIA